MQYRVLRIMKKSMFQLVAAAVLCAGAANAASYTDTFPDGEVGNGNLVGQGSAGLPFTTTNTLVLTTNGASLSGSAFFTSGGNDLDNGAMIDGFTATFNLILGPGSSTPADGFGFCFGPDVLPGVALITEEGFNIGGTTAGQPGGGIAVTWDTYDNGASTLGQLGDPTAIEVWVGANNNFGYTLAGVYPLANTTMVESTPHPVTIKLKRSGFIDVSWNNQTIFTNLWLGGWVPVNGYFGAGARTGGLTEYCGLQNLQITTTLAAAAPPVVTIPPASVTVGEGSNATFNVVFDGEAPLTPQWALNGVNIEGATNATLTLLRVSYTNNNAQITCTVSNGSGQPATSAPATLTVTPDTTPPTVVKVTSDTTFTNVLVTFSKPVSDTALVAAHYSLDQGASVLSVSRIDPGTVSLATSKLTQNTVYNLTINGVQDTAATPNTIAANTKISFHTFVYLSGALLHKTYFNCSPDSFSLANLFADARYPSKPDRVDFATGWEWPPNNAGTVSTDPNKSMFYDSIEGYFVPPTNGDYVFYICGDDEFYLYLSTDENPANLYQIAAEPGGWSDNRAWPTDTTSPGFHSGTPANWVSSTYAATKWPNGNAITLNQGQPYYMIAFHHDHSWSGGDWFGVNFSGGGVAVPATGDATKLSGSVISDYFDATGASLTFNQQPQSVVAVQGATATVSALASGTSVYGTTVFYQWQLAPNGSTTWTNISGATAGSYTTPVLGLADNGTQLRVIATMPPLTATSLVATVTVITDTNPPVATAGALLDPNTPGTVDIGIAFDKTVDASAGVLANYSVSAGTITGIQVYTNRFTADSKNPLATIVRQSVLLTVTGLTGSGSVTVKNVADTYGNKITSETLPFTVPANLSWGVVGANQLGGINAVVPVATNGFDIYSDGIGEWGSYDETTFVFEQVTGNFDKRLRVEYQDGSSEWARAGIIVRESTNVFGMDSATQATQAGRYQKCHVNPVGATLTGPGTGGNAAWEGNRRLDVGGASTTALTGVDSTPQYPNAWCRITRTNQTFSIYRSGDGVNWVYLGETTWGVDDASKTPMPATVFVGPEFSPENGNVTIPADQGTFLASMRDYGDTPTVTTAPPPTLSLRSNSDGTFTLTYTGHLYSSATVNGTYSLVSGASSPYIVNPKNASAAQTFYRAGP